MLKPEDNILSWTKSPFSSEIQNEAKKAYEDWKAVISSELVDAFAVPLTFGTGGIRGKIGNGIGKMNLYTVGRAALGFISYLRDTKKDASIVIAYDSRRLSKEFAELSAGIAAKLGVKVYIFPKVTPTPFSLMRFVITKPVVELSSQLPTTHQNTMDSKLILLMEDN